MRDFYFEGILQNDGWKHNVHVQTDESGRIQSIIENIDTKGKQKLGFAIPGFQNAHSHAFQYAMAGLAEVHDLSSTPDDFWSWRESMYNLALRINPDQMEAIATMLYSEMVRHGYTHVAEFHYVHHAENGKPYDNLAEMGSRLVSAAKTAGINITLVPIFYQKGGFGVAPSEKQKRFISSTIDSYLDLLEASREATKWYSGASIGIGVHSLRGVEPNDVSILSKLGPQDIPFHIHVSEQLKEVEDCLQYTGMRPVDWLLKHIEMNERYHLVHATHLTTEEIYGIAKSRAHVVLCPSTEGNLGDGLFPLTEFQQQGGNWSIGTDSHIGINPLEELRILDYGQRLHTHKRNTFAGKEGKSGEFSIEMALRSGRKAMNNPSIDYFKVGELLNAVVYKKEAPLIETSSAQNRASTIVYASDATHVETTIVNGTPKVIDSAHVENESIRVAFLKALRELKSR